MGAHPLRPDTIVARATPPGVSALAVTRLSGPTARDIGARILPGVDWSRGRTAQVAWMTSADGSRRIDQVVATWFPGPESYTGEDVLEISSHGSALVPELVVQACIEAGARAAEPGEFTRRAVLHGRMDLIQAEAVLDLIEGRSRMQQENALAHLDRGLSERLAELRGAVLELESFLVQHLDFPEEDDPPVPVHEIIGRAGEVAGDLAALLDSAPEGELLREGAIVVLAGAPNAGKSTLFNALVGRERAIVTEEAGTTRDALEAPISVGGFPFILVDTAGLRDGTEGVERRGIEVAERYLADADIVLFCREEGSDEPDAATLADRTGGTVIRLRTKADRGALARDGRTPGKVAEEIAVSGTRGTGLGAVRDALVAAAFPTLGRSENRTALLVRERQVRGVRRALESVDAFRNDLRTGLPPEIAAAHLRTAETALEELLGIISTEDILDRVFRDFCIGK